MESTSPSEETREPDPLTEPADIRIVQVVLTTNQTAILAELSAQVSTHPSCNADLKQQLEHLAMFLGEVTLYPELYPCTGQLSQTIKTKGVRRKVQKARVRKEVAAKK